MDIQKLDYTHLNAKQLADVIDALDTVNDVMSGLLWRGCFWRERRPVPALEAGGAFFEAILNEVYELRSLMVNHAKAMLPTLPPGDAREPVLRMLLREEAYHFEFNIPTAEQALALMVEEPTRGLPSIPNQAA